MGMWFLMWMGIGILMVALQRGNAVASAYEFKVGGLDAWAIPTGGRTDLYQKWVANNTFKVGDSICKFFSSFAFVLCTFLLNCLSISVVYSLGLPHLFTFL